ncbi:MAG TPA: ATP-binding cassette domain-containing protein [Candidatus Aphodousia faecipullorum]|nr:ATP-binding cassette domain-containing protein [Candidatus Aphodousia faecipullorum]
MNSQTKSDVLVQVRHVSKTFDVSDPWLTRVIQHREKMTLKAVDDLSFDIYKGELLSLVGESGCGKSTTAKLLCGLYEPSAGKIAIDGIDMSALGDPKNKELAKALRRRINMIFQDPFASLNPRWRVRDIIAEPIVVQKLLSTQQQIDERVNELMRLVKLNPEDADKFPHQFSGGQRQRISIARALASNPEFLICDEPTSALDVSVQAQILNLMLSIQKKVGLTYLFISHNLSVVHHISDRVGVMYLGRLVELAPTKKIFSSPKHPYTKMLLDAIPDINMTGKPRTRIKGEVPNPLNPPPGCAFHPRCPYATKHCQKEVPKLTSYEQDGQIASVACHLFKNSVVDV